MRRGACVTFIIIFSVFSAGCTRWNRWTNNEIISKALPLSVQDIEEIRVGDENHKALFESNNPYQPPKYKLYTSPELHAYVTHIGMKLARVSIRPNLPYRFFIVDSDDVDLFGLPGGRIYITRGLFNFIQSESELAGGMAHEIGHIARCRYAPEGYSKIKRGFGLVREGADQATGFAGPYGSAANMGLKAIGYAAPRIKKKFSGDQEKEADKDGIQYMLKAGYDPKGLYQLADRLSKVAVEDVGRYVDYLKSHPPNEKRRKFLEKTKRIKFVPKPRMEVRNDVLKVAPSSADAIHIKQAVAEEVVNMEDISSKKENLTAVNAVALTPKS
ncbi:MAG: hypothetical protein A2036_01860 [Omnitrophica bacterium GWA2_50_21]|nr:MAG: hypothetical protein A2036_01860 [Omnitrophica bacterium GWA2_50_21]